MQLSGIGIASKAAAHVQSTYKWKKTQVILCWCCKAYNHTGKYI